MSETRKVPTGNQVRQMFLDFFAQKGFQVEPSASLIPHNDPTLLWINAGVSTLKKYFDGTSKKYFTFMMTDKEIYAAPSDHTFEKSKYPERSTTSVQKYIDVYNGKIKSGFPYK